MRLICRLFSAIAILSLAGCSYEPARISTVPAIVIDGGGYHGHDHDDDHYRDRWDRDHDRWDRDRDRWERERERRERERERWDRD